MALRELIGAQVPDLLRPGTPSIVAPAGRRRNIQEREAMKKFGKPLPTGAPTLVAFARHPLHPMLVTFPIAFFLGALGSDLAAWYIGDIFWARASLWLLGAGVWMGILAGAAGTVELLCVTGIRRRPASWNHFVVAVMLLAVQFFNWLSRIHDPVGSVVPVGIFLSGLGALLVASAGWLGGKLVFEHQIAVGGSDTENQADDTEVTLSDRRNDDVSLADATDR